MAIDRRPDLLQFSGYFHGGVIAALADHAAGGAVTSALPAGRIAVTIDLHVNLLAPAKGEVLNAKARVVQVGSTVGAAQVDLTTTADGTEQVCAVALGKLGGRNRQRSQSCFVMANNLAFAGGTDQVGKSGV
jgi:uncharacterized protein (TIGR00369 family)